MASSPFGPHRDTAAGVTRWPAAASAWLAGTVRRSAVPVASAPLSPEAASADAMVRRHSLIGGLSSSLKRRPMSLLSCDLKCFEAAPSVSPRVRRHAVVVLGVPVLQGDAPNPHLEARIQQAHKLALAYPKAALVTTGAHVTWANGTGTPPPLGDTLVEAAAMQRRLLALGVPTGRIIVEPRARHTVANLALSYQKIEEVLLPAWRQLEHLTLCVEPYHAVRAARIANALLQMHAPHVRLHVSPAQRLAARQLPLSRREEALIGAQLCDQQAVANLNRCQNEKRLVASGW